MSLPSRNCQSFSTGVTVECEGCKVCTRLSPWFSKRGLVLATPGRFQNEEITVDVVNAGREIIEIQDGQVVLECWVEPDHEATWEEA